MVVFCVYLCASLRQTLLLFVFVLLRLKAPLCDCFLASLKTLVLRRLIPDKFATRGAHEYYVY